MAKIQTEIRLINVKETFNQVKEKMDLQWMELTEDISFFGKMSNKMYECEREIRLNRNYIIEVYE